MEILPPTSDGIARAVACLRAGGLVGMPTETVYGLAARASDPVAVAAIFEAKGRPLFDPLIAHVAPGTPLEALRPLVALERLSAVARMRLIDLTSRFWPGPLTLVLPRRPEVPDLVVAGLDSVAVRMPAHPVAAALLRALGEPLVAPSANRFGHISPTTAEHVVRELGDRVPYVLDGGPCAIGVESTVVALDADGSLRLLRPGGVPPEAFGLPFRSRPAGPIEAPGQLARHYAPDRPLILLPSAVTEVEPALLRVLLGGGAPFGLLLASGKADAAAERVEAVAGAVVAVRVLSAVGDAREAARGLFGALRALDADPVRTVVAEPWLDEQGLGSAIADRLRRAGHRSRVGAL